MSAYVFDEPHYTGGNARIEITEDQIKEHMKAEFPHIPAKDQVQEFCTIHGAWKKRADDDAT